MMVLEVGAKRSRGAVVCPTEDEEQIAVMEWAELMSRQNEAYTYLFHIPNGGRRSKREAAIFKAMGVKAGVADLFLAYPSGEYHGLFVEMKSHTGRPSKAQIEFLQEQSAVGYLCAVCYGASAAIDVISKYLSLPTKCRFPAGVEIKPDGVNSLDPCLYEEIQTEHNCTVHVMRCRVCGNVDIMWERGDDDRADT